MDKDFHGLYKNHLQGWKETGGVQAVALCPNHDDTNPSLSINWEDGLIFCFACGYKANAYQFATDVGHPNPREYIVDMNGGGGGSVALHTPEQSSSVVSPPNKAKRQVPAPTSKPEPDLDKLMLQYKNNLKANMDKFPHDEWNGMVSLIDDVHIGYWDDEYYFGHQDVDAELITVREHKKGAIGVTENKWYLSHLFGSHDHSADLYICAGEKDTLCLHSRGYQCTSGTIGEQNIPIKDGLYDLEWLQYYSGWIYICYDHDKTGREGAEKLAQLIIREYPSHKVAVIRWDEHLPEKFDIFDAFTLDKECGQDWRNAVTDAKEIKPVVPDTIGRFKVIGGIDAKTMKYKKTFQIVETLMPEYAQILLGGQTGSNKSTFAMQWGMSIACDMPSFLDFKINGQGKSVLFVDTEVGKNLLLERREMMTNNFADWDDDADMRFNTISLDASSTDETDLFESIEQAIRLFNPDVVFLDCLYNISEGMDISKNYNISKITTIVTKLKVKYQLTVVVVAHFTKLGVDQALVSELIAGGSHLQNWAEHIILLKESGLEDNLRMMRIDKSRAIAYPKCYYGIQLDEHFYLTNAGVIENPKAHLINPDKKNKWAMALDEMPDTFTYQDFRNYVENVMKLKDRTVRNWLTDMVKCHIIERLETGTYKKKLRLIADEDE